MCDSKLPALNLKKTHDFIELDNAFPEENFNVMIIYQYILYLVFSFIK